MGYLEVMVLGDVPAQSVAHLDWRWLKAVAMLQQVGEVFPGMPGIGVELRDLIPSRRLSEKVDGEARSGSGSLSVSVSKGRGMGFGHENPVSKSVLLRYGQNLAAKFERSMRTRGRSEQESIPIPTPTPIHTMICLIDNHCLEATP